MKKLLLLTLLLVLPSPIFADPTDGYKTEANCTDKDDYPALSLSLYKKENSNSEKWGVYSCSRSGSCSWADKAVSYETAVEKYNEKSKKLPCVEGDLSIN